MQLHLSAVAGARGALRSVARRTALSTSSSSSNRSLRGFSTVADDEVNKFNAVATYVSPSSPHTWLYCSCPSHSHTSPLCLNSDWWSPKSTTGVGLLHQLNPVRVKYIRSHVIAHFNGDDDDPEPLKRFRVADVGCGGGILSEALCRIGGSMVSIDPGSANIAAAKHHASQSPVTSAIDYRCCTSGIHSSLYRILHGDFKDVFIYSMCTFYGTQTTWWRRVSSSTSCARSRSWST